MMLTGMGWSGRLSLLIKSNDNVIHVESGTDLSVPTLIKNVQSIELIKLKYYPVISDYRKLGIIFCLLNTL